jgi:hypothetical protein
MEKQKPASLVTAVNRSRLSMTAANGSGSVRAWSSSRRGLLNLFHADRDRWRGQIAARLHRVCGFRIKTLPLAVLAIEFLTAEQPMTLRGLLYRVVSEGGLRTTDHEHYTRPGARDDVASRMG